MDETPLKIVPSSGKTYAKKGSTNVFAYGAGDKRQVTGTPWISFEGKVVLFHTTMKGTTKRCLPKLQFQAQQHFQSPVKIMFSYSPNHWVSKDTMREQIIEVENYRVATCIAKGLPEDSKMLIMWDVYVRHRDKDFLEWMKGKFLHIIVLFIPANLTEICQPLDRYFNACLKRMLYQLRNEQNADRVVASLGLLNGGPSESESGELTRVSKYKPSALLSELKEPFFVNLKDVLARLQTQEKKEKISENCWKKDLFEKCFNSDYQKKCVQLVITDTANKGQQYFSEGNIDPALTKERRFVFQVADDFLDSQRESTIFTAAMASTLAKVDLIGKRVEAMDGRYPGYVKEYNKKKDLFKVRYYKEGNERGRAKKLVIVKYEDLLEKLVYTYAPNNDDEEEDNEEYALVDVNEDDEADSDSTASTSEEDSDEDSLCF